MKLLETVHSKIDNTVKYIFLSRGKDIIEASYINKNDGKDIICIPTQTSCRMKCKFCFLSDLNIRVRILSSEEMFAAITYIAAENRKNDTLLVSFMGCGEPLENFVQVPQTIEHVGALFLDEYKYVRIGLASLVPTVWVLEKFLGDLRNIGCPLKFHYSLHSPKQQVRKMLMPAAADFNEVLPILRHYAKDKIKVEMHYSLIDGVNDTREDAKLLSELVKPFPVKVLKLSEKHDSGLEGSVYAQQFRQWLDEEGVQNEYYEPPGADVGASCGQFLLDYYKKYGLGENK